MGASVICSAGGRYRVPVRDGLGHEPCEQLPVLVKHFLELVFLRLLLHLVPLLLALLFPPVLVGICPPIGEVSAAVVVGNMIEPHGDGPAVTAVRDVLDGPAGVAAAFQQGLSWMSQGDDVVWRRRHAVTIAG